VQVSVRTLLEPATASWKVPVNLGPAQREPIEIDDIDVGLEAGGQFAPIHQPHGPCRVARLLRDHVGQLEPVERACDRRRRPDLRLDDDDVLRGDGATPELREQ
jgi:hypothetical protein